MSNRAKGKKPKPKKDKTGLLAKRLAKLGPRPPAEIPLTLAKQHFDAGEADKLKTLVNERLVKVQAWDERHDKLLRDQKLELWRNDPERFQEVHSPTVAYEIRGDVRTDQDTMLPKLEKIGVARRRRDDAELSMNLTADQLASAEELIGGYEAAMGGLAIKGASYEQRVDSSPRTPAGPDVDRASLADVYLSWARFCTGAGIDVDAVLEVVVAGYSCRWVDKARSKRNGWAAEQVRRGLDCWDSARPRKQRMVN